MRVHRAVFRVSGLFFCATALFSAQQASADDFTNLSFEELLSTEVTSVAKRPQLADEAAAALFVITQDDIRKTGATTVPELLRLVPGMDVGQVDGTITAVSSRGFNWRFTNKLLVLVDGRAVYQPFISGVVWDMQMVPVENINRIEVIRGPGATLYGANAVNGVINIVTKHAADSLGGEASVRLGTTKESKQSFGRVFAQQGGRFGQSGAYRLYASAKKAPSLADQIGGAIDDGELGIQVGFRTDWEPDAKNAFTLQGDIQEFDYDLTTSNMASSIFSLVPSETSNERSEGFNILGRWSHSVSDTNKVTVQAYVDDLQRTELDADVSMRSYDFDLSHYFSWGKRFETVWGAGYRKSDDEIVSRGFLSYRRPKFSTDLYSAFLQQDVVFYQNRLKLSAGSKFEHNDYTGFETQPSIRAIWIDDKNWSLWGAASRAIRTPSRFETELQIDYGSEPADLGLGLPVALTLIGDDMAGAEDLIAVEAGFRKTWNNGNRLDISAYHNWYDELIDLALGDTEFIFAPTGPGGSVVPVSIDQDVFITNAKDGETRGVEVALRLHPREWWTLNVAGDYKISDFIDQPPALLPAFSSGLTPKYQISVRSDFEITPKLDTSVWVRHIDELTDSKTGAYTDLNVNTAYRVTPKLDVNFLAENLLNNGRLEFASELYPTPAGYVEPKASVTANVRF